MAKEDLKQMTNRVALQGTLMDNNLAIKLDSQGRRYISGDLEVKVDNDYVIPVSVFAFEMKSNGQKSGIFDGLAKTIDYPSVRTAGLQDAAKVAITGARIEDNSFYSERDDRVVNNWRISTAFVRTASVDATPQNDFEVEGVIASIKEVIDNEGNSTDAYNLKLLNVGFGNRVNELTFRFDDKEAVDYINTNYNLGDFVTLCGRVVYEQHERVIEKELGFGEPVKQTYTNTIRLLKINAGTPPIDEEESGYKLKDLQNIIVQQNNIITEKYKARAQATAAEKINLGADLLF